MYYHSYFSYNDLWYQKEEIFSTLRNQLRDLWQQGPSNFVGNQCDIIIKRKSWREVLRTPLTHSYSFCRDQYKNYNELKWTLKKFVKEFHSFTLILHLVVRTAEYKDNIYLESKWKLLLTKPQPLTLDNEIDGSKS